jgi:hypothetical protein
MRKFKEDKSTQKVGDRVTKEYKIYRKRKNKAAKIARRKNRK